jgi:nitrate/TMAO reductase-like tetraheme cytochrome c subunit
VNKSWKFGLIGLLVALVTGWPSGWSEAVAPAHPATLAEQLSTEDHLRKKSWWPTKGTFPADSYVGVATCAQCHADIVAAQKRTSMAQTAARANASEHLLQHPLTYKLGPYTYQMARSGDAANYIVTDETSSYSASLQWAFGIRMGQSFLFERNGGIFMAPLTYYPEAGRWDFTVDQPHSAPESFDKSVGRRLKDDEVRGCFNCHNTAATTNDRFDPQHSTPGVMCEACHGPGADHVSAVKSGLAEQGTTMILNPRLMTPVESIDFCGSCHRTWWDVTLSGSTGITSLRFPPYRLENSRCWGKGDARLTCVACHDPHQPLERRAGAYDSRCLSCHVNTVGAKITADHPGAACPVARKECVSCHMPKAVVTDIPVKFTDHQIRVVRTDDAIPK